MRMDCHGSDFVSFTIPHFDSSFPGHPKIDFARVLRTYSKPSPPPPLAPPSPPAVTAATAVAISSITPSDGHEDSGGDEETKSSLNDEKKKETDLEMSETNDEPPELLQRTLKRNRYENIIERLERKYCGSIITETHENSDEEEEVVDTQPRKKKAINADYYDMEDPFIDDTDNIATVETHLKMNKIQTKHDGYFVSSGVLEIHTSNTLKPISDSQLEEAMASISKTSPEISSKLESAYQSLKNLAMNEEISTSKISIPPSLIPVLLELDALALSHKVDITRQISKLKSPYRVWIGYFFQTLVSLSSQAPTEEKLEGFLQTLKKLILKKRTTNGGPMTKSGSTTLRERLDCKIQEVGEKIRSKIEEKSKDASNSAGPSSFEFLILIVLDRSD